MIMIIFTLYRIRLIIVYMRFVGNVQLIFLGYSKKNARMGLWALLENTNSTRFINTLLKFIQLLILWLMLINF